MKTKVISMLTVAMFVSSCFQEPLIHLGDGLVASYPFDGNANDATGDGHDGVINGAVLCADRFGNENRACYFNGISNILVGGDITAFYNMNYSYSFWFEPTLDVIEGQSTYMLSIGGPAGDQCSGLTNSSFIGFQGGGYGSADYVTCAAIGRMPAINSWYHITVTRSNNEVKLYINGSLKVTQNTENHAPFYTTGPGSHFTIGSRYNSEQFATGKIDDIRIYNRVLNADEVYSLYGIE
jgi:hypothetical protein